MSAAEIRAPAAVEMRKGTTKAKTAASCPITNTAMGQAHMPPSTAVPKTSPTRVAGMFRLKW